MDFSSRNVETGFQHLCESVFVRLCQIVGTSVQVAIRRETKEICEMVERRVAENKDVIEMQSGSVREGFRLERSDVDYMYWFNDHRVIWDMSQSEYYYTENKTLILSDSSESPPGFTLLELLTPTYREVLSACVPMNDKLYISSSLYRQQTQFHRYPGSREHGPCESGEILGVVEYDFAQCFACDFWPPSASSWINRCHSWPDREVVDDIIKNGCHFVPIGHPLGLHEQEEWRISFSVAEHKLVHTMNHCQFLTYGLLKIFLKEVIEDKQSTETNKLLCSYHMKTAVFWVIQQNVVPLWCPQNILVGFWVCFKLLLRWVYEGVCPNFFILQNNLFLTKIHGSAQRSLFLKLHGLYEKGLACLLQSPSIRSYITDVLYNPRLSICSNEDRMISECECDVELYSEIDRNVSQAPENLACCITYLQAIELMIGLPLTQCQVLMLQKITANILQSTAFTLHNMYTNTGLNKQMYIADRISHHMLKLAANFGYISDMMYIAMHYYKALRYRDALSITEIIKVKLTQPGLMYKRRVDPERYTEAVGGQSWSTKMRQAVTHDITLNNYVCYINELTTEQQSALQYNRSFLIIPLFVVLHFVEFLCYRHIDTTLAQTALEELQVLVHHDQGLYISDLYRDISWEILGICQQMTGNLQAALFSYQQSQIQNQIQWNKIHTASQMRIQDLHIIDTSMH
ncbi:uncharacterized protein LOC144620613 [Crassostrea virginica]